MKFTPRQVDSTPETCRRKELVRVCFKGPGKAWGTVLSERQAVVNLNQRADFRLKGLPAVKIDDAGKGFVKLALKIQVALESQMRGREGFAHAFGNR